MKVFILKVTALILFSQSSMGSDLFNAPTRLNPEQAPIDIIETNVKMVIGPDMRSVEVYATTSFVTNQAGKPLLFLRMNVEDAKLNGQSVRIVPTSLFMEENSASYIDQAVEPGVHTLTFKGNFLRNPSFINQFVRIDYIKGDFTERALPANFLYDFYKLTIDFELQSEKAFKLISNGTVTTDKTKPNKFGLEFPERFNSSYFFMDFIPAEQVVEEYSLTSIDGRQIDVNIYIQQPWLEELGRKFKTEVNEAFIFLESHLGPYPYDSIEFKVIDNNRGGAYAGALILGREYSGDGWIVHELGHSWFLKGVSPTNGFDGWFYEGFAEWARFGFPRADDVYGVFRNVIRYSPDSPNQKFTNESWDKGRIVLSHLDKLLEPQGGLVPLMKKLHAEKKGQSVSTDQFFKFLNEQTQIDFTEFRMYYFR